MHIDYNLISEYQESIIDDFCNYNRNNKDRTYFLINFIRIMSYDLVYV